MENAIQGSNLTDVMRHVCYYLVHKIQAKKQGARCGLKNPLGRYKRLEKIQKWRIADLLGG